jgi:hypothetical protein
MELRGNPDCKDRRGLRVSKEAKVAPECRDLRVSKASRALPAHQVLLGLWGHRDPKAQLVPKAKTARTEPTARTVPKVTLEPKASKV